MRERVALLAIVLVLALTGMKYFSRPPAALSATNRGIAQSTAGGAPLKEGGLLPKGLEAKSVADLAGWMMGDPTQAPAPSRNPFQYGSAPIRTLAQPAPLPEPAPAAVLPSEPIDDLRLTGFIVRSRGGGAETVAVLRIGSDIFLAAAGETAGAYRVDEIVGQEEVRLVDTTTGQRRVLRIVE